MISYRIKFFNYFINYLVLDLVAKLCLIFPDISQTQIIFSLVMSIFLRINDDIICSEFNFQLSHKVQNGLLDDKVKHFGEAN